MVILTKTQVIYYSSCVDLAKTEVSTTVLEFDCTFLKSGGSIHTHVLLYLYKHTHTYRGLLSPQTINYKRTSGVKFRLWNFNILLNSNV